MKKSSRLSAAGTILKVAFKADPWRTFISLLLYALGAAGAPLFAFSLGALADGLATGEPSGRITVLAVLLGASAGLTLVVSEMAWKAVELVQERTAHHIDRHILEMVMGVPGIEHHERAEYLDKLGTMRGEQWLLSSAVPSLWGGVTLILQLIFTVVLLARVSPILMVMPLFAIPALWTSGKAEKLRVAGIERVQPEWRRTDDLLDLTTTPGPAKEIRVFGLAPELMKRHDRASELSLEGELYPRVKGAWWIVSGRVVFILGYLLAIFVVLNQIFDGSATVGDLLLTITLAGQFVTQLAAAAWTVTWMTASLTAVERYQWLTNYAKGAIKALHHRREVPERIEHGIKFEHVSFTYPGTEKEVLRDLDIILPAGSTVAIIGDNGVGKSTIMKLLGRMYEPTEGRILIDDVPLDEIDIDTWRSSISAAFQDHFRLEALAEETVGVGDLPHLGDEEAVTGAVERGGAEGVVQSMPSGLKTQLGAGWDNGIDLSGGQWQKLALARGMMRDPLLLTLDEPTSALDAESEHNLFERYADATRRRARSRGAMTILVSHRFSTTRMADLIIVISEGKAVEVGSHTDLMAKGGLYAELYELQARAYR